MNRKIPLSELVAIGFTLNDIRAFRADERAERLAAMRKKLRGNYAEHAIECALDRYDKARAAPFRFSHPLAMALATETAKAMNA